MIYNDSLRVRRPSEFDDLLDKMVKKDKVFQTLKNALVFSASVGFKKKMRLSFEKSSEPIKITVFDKEQDLPFIISLAIAETSNIGYMGDDKFSDAILIFEEYSNGGLSYINSVYDSASSVQSLEKLISEQSDVDDVSLLFNDW